MAGFFVMLYGMVAFFGIITLLDWLARRKDRQSQRPQQIAPGQRDGLG